VSSGAPSVEAAASSAASPPGTAADTGLPEAAAVNKPAPRRTRISLVHNIQSNEYDETKWRSRLGEGCRVQFMGGLHAIRVESEDDLPPTETVDGREYTLEPSDGNTKVYILHDKHFESTPAPTLHKAASLLRNLMHWPSSRSDEELHMIEQPYAVIVTLPLEQADSVLAAGTCHGSLRLSLFAKTLFAQGSRLDEAFVEDIKSQLRHLSNQIDDGLRLQKDDTSAMLVIMERSLYDVLVDIETVPRNVGHDVPLFRARPAYTLLFGPLPDSVKDMEVSADQMMSWVESG
jgi:hypothetical protein